MRSFTSLVVVGLVMVVACKDPRPSVYPAQAAHIEDSTVETRDLIEIKVIKHDALGGEFEIDGNGQISFPYIGLVEARGKTAQMIQDEIHARLADGYLRNPQVTVRVKVRNSKKVSVFGEVRQGAVVPFVDGMTIIEAISAAGGFTPRAWENAVRVKRKTAASAIQEFTIPVKSIAAGSAAPFYMRPGDSVYVPKSPM